MRRRKHPDGSYCRKCGRRLDATGRCCICSHVDPEARRAFKASGGIVRDWTWHRLCNTHGWAEE